MAWMAVLFFCSCENDPAAVGDLAAEAPIPLEIQKDFELWYSDSSFIRMKMQAPLAERYPQLEEPYLEFREGIKVRFFDPLGQETSRLRADYAIQYIKENRWLAQGDVVVNNLETGEQLNTEELHWDEREEIIYGDKFVKITTDREIIMGEGFKADQDFSAYEINKVTGTLLINEDE